MITDIIGISEHEVDSILHLTRLPGEPYRDYIVRVNLAPDPVREVKVADLRDHLAAPEYLTPSYQRRYQQALDTLTRRPVSSVSH